MTKFILHGGATSLPSIHNNNFFAEMVKSLPEPVKILTVYFAVPKEKWEELLEDDKKKFSSANPSKNMEFTIASNNPELLVDQISLNDVIYIRGGRDYVLFEIFKKIKNLKELLKGKVVVGSSMGAYLISKYFYSGSNDKIMNGFNLIPVKVLAHYSDERKEGLKKLEEYKEDLDVYALSEAEFVVIEK